MAIGKGYGNSGPVEAARQAIANPLLNLSIDKAKGVLFMVKGGSQALTLGGVNAAGNLIAETVRKDANIFFGMGIDESMGEEVRLTLIATGLQSNSLKPSQDTAGENSTSGNPGFGASLRKKLRPPRIPGRR